MTETASVELYTAPDAETVDRPDLQPAPARRLTLAPYIDRYLTERRKRGELTLSSWRNRRYQLDGLAESFGNRPIEQFGPRAVERWQESVGHLSPATRRLYLSGVRTFGRWLLIHRVIKRDPTLGVALIPQPRKMSRALPADDTARMLAAAPDARSRAIVWLMLGCALRCVEVSRLNVADYDHKARTLFVVGKGGHERVLPVPGEVARVLNAYLAEEGHVHGPLIRNQSRPSSGLMPAYISELVGRVVRDAGIKARPYDGISAHACRHTAASDVLDKSHDLRIVQQLLGHKNLSTTSIYLRQATTAEMRAAMEGRDYRRGSPATPTEPDAVSDDEALADVEDLEAVAVMEQLRIASDNGEAAPPAVPMLRCSEVAPLFDVTERTIINWAAEGKLPSRRTAGGHLRFRLDDVQALLGKGSDRGE